MTDWKEVPLTELGKFSSGKSIKPGLDGPFRAFGSNGVIGGSAESRHRHGVIVGRVGAYCGSVAVSRDPFWASDNTIVVEPLDPADLDFLYYLLLSANLNQHAGGAAQPLVTQATLKSLSFRVPMASGRSKLGGVLRALDDLIENNRRRVEVLEEMARAIYREWFVHFRYPGHEDVPLVDSPLGPIPDGWRVSTCGDELTALGGGTPSKKEPAYWDGGDIPWYTPSDLTKSGWRYAARPEMAITAEGLARSSARLFRAGSVLMTSRATLGVLAIATFDATTNQGFIVIPPDERWSPGFIREWLDRHAADLASVATGATFKEITKGAFKRVPFLVPRQQVLDAHRDVTAPIEAQIRILEEQTRSLAGLRDLLLPRLVTGQIDVSHLDLEALTEVATA